MTQRDWQDHQDRLRQKLTETVSAKLDAQCEFVRWEPFRDARGRETGATVPVFRVPAEKRELALSLGLRIEAGDDDA